MATRLDNTPAPSKPGALSKLMWTDFVALFASLAVIGYAVYQACI